MHDIRVDSRNELNQALYEIPKMFVPGTKKTTIQPIRLRSGIKRHFVGVLGAPTPKAKSYHP